MFTTNFRFFMPKNFFRTTLLFINRIKRYGYYYITSSQTNKRILFASLAGFSFQLNGIEDIKQQKNLINNSHFTHPEQSEGWECMYTDNTIKVFRKKRQGNDGSQYFEYQCIGTYKDISVEDFIQAQYDIDYRREWDGNIKRLEILEEDYSTGFKLVRWETKYPYPLYPRLYIYLQQTFIDEKAKTVLILNKAVDEQTYSDSSSGSNNCVRVTDYDSKLFVRAHEELNKNGLDFVLIYHDDPKAPIPKRIYDFGVNVIGPSFLSSVHSAALKLAKDKNLEKEIRKTQRQRIVIGIENNNEDYGENCEQNQEHHQQQTISICLIFLFTTRNFYKLVLVKTKILYKEIQLKHLTFGKSVVLINCFFQKVLIMNVEIESIELTDPVQHNVDSAAATNPKFNHDMTDGKKSLDFEEPNETNGSGILPKSRSWIKLNVGGKLFMTTIQTLCRESGSFLARLSQEDHSLPSEMDESGFYLIDRDSDYFSSVLNYLRHGKVILDHGLSEEGLREEAEFYNLPKLIALCKERIADREKQRKSLTKHVYRVLQCHEDELTNVISAMSDGWKFEQLVPISQSSHPSESGQPEYLCVVSREYPVSANASQGNEAASDRAQFLQMKAMNG
ncbi:START domain-containing protein [Meloidogyne graminicola]|uniref:Phosphatidylcholine transfer protein n=1 Tax=Meloidogyne graminicola TaxID=189291 RepID=A0A8S9ZDM4_9BILA|nr:START domain-containing protein [Meloidogyne graminicola]